MNNIKNEGFKEEGLVNFSEESKGWLQRGWGLSGLEHVEKDRQTSGAKEQHRDIRGQKAFGESHPHLEGWGKRGHRYSTS